MNTIKNLNETGFSRQQLLGRSESISDSAKRDLLFFQEHGITTDYLTQFDAKRVEFEKTVQHIGVIAEHKQITNLLFVKFGEFLDRIRMIRSALVLFEISEEKADVAVLHSKLPKHNVSNLINLGEQTLQFLEANKLELSAYSITDEKITAFSTLLEEFRALHYKQSNMLGNVDNQTKNRSDLKSELYKMVYFISSVGKSYWLRKNKTCYKDYVLNKRKYSPPTGGASEEETATTTVNSF